MKPRTVLMLLAGPVLVVMAACTSGDQDEYGNGAGTVHVPVVTTTMPHHELPSCGLPTAPRPPHPAVVFTMRAATTAATQRPGPPAPQLDVGDHLALVLPGHADLTDFHADPASNVDVIPTAAPGPQKHLDVTLLQPGDVRFTATDSNGRTYGFGIVVVC